MMSAVLVNNYVLRQFLGICPFLGVSKELKNSVGMSLAIIFVMMLASAVTWPIQRFLLDPHGMGFMQIVVFILIIAVLVQFIEIVLKRYVPALYKALGVFLPLMTTNCAILAVVIVNINEGFTFIEALTNAFGAGLGFLLAMVMFSGIRAYTENADPPESFKGLPMALISAAILSMSFFGFTGVAENLFS
ncbi:MAG: RnfABCDGE type electron transport complex subunit A [Oscillospiraceae bacterium]|nr:RnfABCDGE type electron transport complex subunit A [Oscillospiraceae bacterium]